MASKAVGNLEDGLERTLPQNCQTKEAIKKLVGVFKQKPEGTKIKDLKKKRKDVFWIIAAPT